MMSVNAKHPMCSRSILGLPAESSDDLLRSVAAKHPTFPRIVSLETFDVRFPTSRDLDGSDAMNPDPDYSAAYVVIGTDAGDGLEGHGFAFTIGRGNDVQVGGHPRARAVHRSAWPLDTPLGDVWRSLVHDSQLRWLGPEKGVMHMAISAVVNALWDLAAKRAGKPLWRLLADMSPEELVELVDFRYLTDALTRAEALEILQRARPGRAERTARLLEDGYPAYTTTPGWLGYSDAKLSGSAARPSTRATTRSSSRSARTSRTTSAGCGSPARSCGPDMRIAVDANQRWDVEDGDPLDRRARPYDP